MLVAIFIALIPAVTGHLFSTAQMVAVTQPAMFALKGKGVDKYS